MVMNYWLPPLENSNLCGHTLVDLHLVHRCHSAYPRRKWNVGLTLSLPQSGDFMQVITDIQCYGAH